MKIGISVVAMSLMLAGAIVAAPAHAQGRESHDPHEPPEGGPIPDPITVHINDAKTPFKACGQLTTLKGQRIGRKKTQCFTVRMVDIHNVPKPGPESVSKVCGQVIDRHGLYVISGRRQGNKRYTRCQFRNK